MRYIVDVGNEDWSTLLVLAELDIEPFVATLNLLSFYSFLPLYAQNLEG